MKTKLLTSMRKLLLILFVLVANLAIAQDVVPLILNNTSEFRDDEVYIGIVGKTISEPKTHLWVDPRTGNQFPMSTQYNTLNGPVYNGNMGPGGAGKYANIFVKLSEIPNKTIMVKKIHGCRVFFAVKSPMYLYFFGPTGGFSAPDHFNTVDPNRGIKHDFMELSFDNIGYWANTTRVDRYEYPVSVELFSADGQIQRTGELKKHTEIGAAFKASVPVEFQGCYDPATGSIAFPTKTKDFVDGSIGGLPRGKYAGYLDGYITSVWNKYTNEDLIFNGEMDGVWKGRVINGQLVMTCISGQFLNRRGIVQAKPTTQEAFEGKGVLDRVIQDGLTDLVVQKHVCAALTRHMISTGANPGVQQWGDVSKFYQESPCNHYAKFWHQQGISVNRMAYGFCYDDVFEQSSTVSVRTATKVIAYFGGFSTNTNNVAPTVSITSPGNSASFNAPATVNIAANASDSDGSITKVEFFNGSTKLGEDVSSPYTFSWTNVAAGSYALTAKATDNAGAVTTSGVVNINVTGTVTQTPYGGTAASIPGTVEMENYDNGGQNVAFNDVSGNNEGGAYRSDAVDIEAVSGGGYNVGWIVAGEWLEYTVNVKTAGAYRLEARVAATAPDKSFKVQLDGSDIATINVPNTGGWQNWSLVTVNTSSLSAGQKVLRVYANTSDFNLDRLTFTALTVTNAAPTATLTSPANNTNYNAPASITITANASDSDGSISKVEFYNGSALLGSRTAAPYSFTWSNVAAGTYTITARAYDNQNATGNSGAVTVRVNAPQAGMLIQAEAYNFMSGVMIEATRDVDGVSNVGSIDGNDWMAYSNITIPTSGAYLIEYRVASIYNGATISLDLNGGSVVLGEIVVPNTGNWQAWRTISHTVNINAGTYNFGIFAKVGGFNLNWWKITKVNSTARLAAAEPKIDMQTLSVYPNPADEILSIITPSEVKDGTYSIVNGMGIVSKSGSFTNNTIDLSDLNAGFYTIIINSDKTYSKTFIRN